MNCMCLVAAQVPIRLRCDQQAAVSNSTITSSKVLHTSIPAWLTAALQTWKLRAIQSLYYGSMSPQYGL